MVNLEALSREIAATSDKWMVRGVRCLDRGLNISWQRNAFVWVRNAADTMLWYPEDLCVSNSVEQLHSFQSLKRAIANGPDLSDPVTVNALLGDTGEVHHLVAGHWHAEINGHARGGVSRTEAIARAWIAAQKGEP